MFLSKTKIINYKYFRHKIQIQNFGPGINILVGTNGSGKTTFLEAIGLLFQDFDKESKLKKFSFDNFKPVPFRKTFSIIQISLENSDRRIPVPKNFVKIRRVIGKNFDRFLILDQNLSLKQFFSFLDSLGVCKEKIFISLRQGEQTHLKEMNPSVRFKFLEKLAGEQTFYRFKVKINSLLKNLTWYKNKILKKVGEIKENIKYLPFPKLNREKKKLVKASYFILEKKIEFNFLNKIIKKLQEKRRKKTEGNILRIIFLGRYYQNERKIVFLEHFNNLNFIWFSIKNKDSLEKFCCPIFDCQRIKKIRNKKVFFRIQKTEKFWEKKMKKNFFIHSSLWAFSGKRKQESKVFTSEEINRGSFLTKFFQKETLLVKKNFSKKKQKNPKNFWVFYEKIFSQHSWLKIKNFKNRQKLCFFLFLLFKEIENLEKNLKNYEKNLIRFLGNKALFGVQIVTGVLKKFSDLRPKVFGLLLDLFSTHRFFYRPIENYLQKTLAYIVIENKETAFGIIRFLKKKFPVKTNFILLETVRNPSIEKSISPLFFPIVLAIFFRPKFSLLFRNFFNDVYLTKNPLKIFRNSSPLRTQLVTLEGEIFFSNGIVSFRTETKKGSIFEVVSNLKKERKLFEIFKKRSKIIKFYLSSLEKIYEKFCSLFLLSDKIQKILKTQKIIFKSFTLNHFKEKFFAEKLNLLRKGKFLKPRKIIIPSLITFEPLKRPRSFLKTIRAFMSQFYFFSQGFRRKNSTLTFFKLYKKRIKSNNSLVQSKPRNQKDYSKKFELEKNRNKLERILKIQEFSFFFFSIFWNKIYSGIQCSFLEKTIKTLVNFQKPKLPLVGLNNLFTKKEKTKSLILFGRLLKKKQKFLLREIEKKKAKQGLLGLIDFSKEIDSDFFIINQVFEILIKKQKKKIKKALSEVSKNFIRIFNRTIKGGRGCLVLEFKSFSKNFQKKTQKKKKEPGFDILAKFEETRSFSYLKQMSTGQTSLVSLILLLSVGGILGVLIYIFDEPDSHLDSKNCLLFTFLFKKFSSSGNQFLISTFRKEIVFNGDKWFGISAAKNFTKLRNIQKRKALEFTLN